MNDSSELSYAAELIHEVFLERLAAFPDPRPRETLILREDMLNPFVFDMRPYVACFCEDGDLLSQWRGYSRGRTGVSIGLKLYPDLPDFPGMLRKVVYEPTTQRELVAEAVDNWLTTTVAILDQGIGVRKVFPYPALWAIQRALEDFFLCFKHPAFSEEKEWRLIRLVAPREEVRFKGERRRETELNAMLDQISSEYGRPTDKISLPVRQRNVQGLDVRFRESPLGLTPYVELPLLDSAGVFARKLPLWEVTHGPTDDVGLRLEALAMFLEAEGYGFHTKVSASHAPLRSWSQAG
jgi:hypothetical protein